jgi:thiamine biosynthesis lipoprotein
MDAAALHERRFHALGTVVHVVAEEHRHISIARERLQQLERRWSRFVSTSDVVRCNRLAGRPCAVHPETLDLVQRAVDAWTATGGLFDPTIHDALVDAGYDRTFEVVAARHPAPALDAASGTPTDGEPRSAHPTSATAAATRAAQAGDIEIDERAGTITLPPGLHLDLGGIGKGQAADLVAADLVAAGSEHVLVNLGGDLRAVGGHPCGGPWRIAVQRPVEADRHATELLIDDGAIATSSVTKRRWTRHGRVQHHLIDPRTGRPAATDLHAVTVVSARAVDADVWAKAALIAGEEGGIDLLAGQHLPALLASADGRWSATEGLSPFLDPSTLVVSGGEADSHLATGPEAP